MIRFWLLACSLAAGASVLPGASNSFLIARLRVMPERWNKEANFQKIEHWAREAAAQGAHIVITPEGLLDGYVANDSAIRA